MTRSMQAAVEAGATVTPTPVRSDTPQRSAGPTGKVHIGDDPRTRKYTDG